jgi:hypothetical protein
MSDAKTPIGKVAEYVKERIPVEVAKAVSEIEVPAGKDGVDGIGFNLKSWEAGIYREGTMVQHNIGQAFKALRDTSDEPGTSEDWERVGSQGFRWTGVKSLDAEYQEGDLYIDGGTTFMWVGGKGRMVAQRGRNGKDGIDGKDGKDGSNAPQITEIRWDAKGVAFVFDNGDLVEADVDGLEAIQKRLTWLEEQLLAEENVEAPIKAYKGTWKAGESYAVGDTVNSTGGFYLCIKADSRSTGLDPDKWVKLAGVGGGGGSSGGGSGIARSSTIIGDGALNMGNFLVTNVGDPRAGPVGVNDAVNRHSMEQAIAAGSLYQGVYKPSTNTPDLWAQTDSGFVAPVAGDKVSEPNVAAPQPNAANVLVWFNFKNHGLDTFSATLVAPIQIEVTYSDGTKSDINLPAGVYADVNAVETALNALLAGTKVLAYHGYVNGADFWIGVETLPAVYAVSLAGSTGGGFGAATPGANNRVLNTYNWVVSTTDPNVPEYAPAGIPGIAPGTTLRNSDLLQWNGNLRQFEIIRGGNLTQAFADSRYWQLARGNMAWVDQAYAANAIVYSRRHNAWFYAVQNIVAGTAEPGGNLPLVQPPTEWKKINSSYGSHVFFGRGDYDTTNTTRANNWGMPANTFPPGQQPETGDSYYDLLTGSLAEFTVTKHAPIYTLTQTVSSTATPNLSPTVANLNAWARGNPALLPVGQFAKYTNTTGAPVNITNGLFAGTTIPAASSLYLISSGDVDADNAGWIPVIAGAAVTNPSGTINTPHPQSVPDTVAATILWGQTRIGRVTIPTGTAKDAKVTLVYNIPADESFSEFKIEDADGGGALYSFEVLTSAGATPQISATSVLARNSKIKEFCVKWLDATDNVAIVVVLEQTLTSPLNLDIVVSSRDYNLGGVVFNNATAAKVPASLTDASFFDAQRNYPSVFRKVSKYTYDTDTAGQERLLVSHIPNAAAVYTITLAGKGATLGQLVFDVVINANNPPKIIPKLTLKNRSGNQLYTNVRVQWVSTGFDVWLLTTTGAQNDIFDLIVECSRPDIMNNCIVYDGTYSSTHTGFQDEFTHDTSLPDFIGPFRLCTQAQYDAITHKNSNVLYLISA